LHPYPSGITGSHAGALIAATFQIPVHPGLDAAALRYITEAVRAPSEGNGQ